MEIQEIPVVKDEKLKKLFLGLLFDGIGMISFSIPLLGEFSDVIWAPVAAYYDQNVQRQGRSCSKYFDFCRRDNSIYRCDSILYDYMDLYVLFSKTK